MSQLKYFLAIIFISALSLVNAQAQVNFRSNDFKTALNDAEKMSSPVMIYFTADWCQPCKLMDRESFHDTTISGMLNDNFKSYKFDIEKEKDGENIANKYKVGAYPTLVFIDKSGKETGRVEGYYSKDVVLNTVKSQVQKCAKRNFTTFR